MREFAYERPADIESAIVAGSAVPEGKRGEAISAYLAGGTTLLDLMKLDVMRPRRIVDIGDLANEFGRIEERGDFIHIGSFVHMAEAEEHLLLRRELPVLVQTLQQAASAQIRNMATLGGNVLQRTRCNYFRDTSWAACNKRSPGSGCAALQGVNRKHAVLGVSDSCIATYPGDFAQSLMVLDASVDIAGPSGARAIRFETLHVEPGNSPDRETMLAPGDIITGFSIPKRDWNRRSAYLKIRDRASYEFALASAAICLNLRDGVVADARIALGGVATKPWRAREAENLLKGQAVNEARAAAAANAAFAGAVPHGGNGYKIQLGKNVLVRALLETAAMEV